MVDGVASLLQRTRQPAIASEDILKHVAEIYLKVADSCWFLVAGDCYINSTSSYVLNCNHTNSMVHYSMVYIAKSNSKGLCIKLLEGVLE